MFQAFYFYKHYKKQHTFIQKPTFKQTSVFSSSFAIRRDNKREIISFIRRKIPTSSDDEKPALLLTI